MSDQPTEKRQPTMGDRRRVARGGRRATDRSGRDPRVLLADSSEAARRPTVRCLSMFGFHVVEVATGEEGAAALEASCPQLAIADTALRGGSTLTTAAVGLWGVPLIVTTTDAEAEMPPGAAGVLVKPFTLSAMLDEVRRVLRLAERTGRVMPGA